MIIRDEPRMLPFNFNGDPAELQKQAAARDARTAQRRKELEAMDAKQDERRKMAEATKAAGEKKA